jgi:HlyD family secretion protein
VEASIEVWTGHDRLLIPGGALFRQGDGWATYVVDHDRAHLRPVVIGRRNSAMTEVIKGVAPGERVVLYPTDRVREGARTRAR